MRRRGRPGLLGVAARTAVVAGTATAVSGSVRNKQEAKQEAAQQGQQQEQAEQQQIAEQQQQIDQLQSQEQPAQPAGGGQRQRQRAGPEEFEAAKAKLLAS